MCYGSSFPVEDWLSIADIRQFQLRQTALDSFEVAVAMDGRLNEEQIRLLESKRHKSLNYAFKLKFYFVSSIEVQKNGKYEDFISML